LRASWAGPGPVAPRPTAAGIPGPGSKFSCGQLDGCSLTRSPGNFLKNSYRHAPRPIACGCDVQRRTGRWARRQHVSVWRMAVASSAGSAALPRVVRPRTARARRAGPCHPREHATRKPDPTGRKCPVGCSAVPVGEEEELVRIHRIRNHRSPKGSIYPIWTRFHIPDFSLISGSPGDKASQSTLAPAEWFRKHSSYGRVLPEALWCQ